MQREDGDVASHDDLLKKPLGPGSPASTRTNPQSLARVRGYVLAALRAPHAVRNSYSRHAQDIAPAYYPLAESGTEDSPGNDPGPLTRLPDPEKVFVLRLKGAGTESTAPLFRFNCVLSFINKGII